MCEWREELLDWSDILVGLILIIFASSYTVEYCEVNNSTCRSQNVSSSRRNTTLSGLLACTAYMVSITPYYEAGQGPSLNISLYTRVLSMRSQFHFLMFIQSFLSNCLNFELKCEKINGKLWKISIFIAEPEVINTSKVISTTSTSIEVCEWREPIKDGCRITYDVCICGKTSNCSPELLQHNQTLAFDFKQNISRGKQALFDPYYSSIISPILQNNILIWRLNLDSVRVSACICILNQNSHVIV